MSQNHAVQHQYTLCPYPPLETCHLSALPSPASSWAFAHYYCSHRHTENISPLILDAGCGTGFSTLKLIQANPKARIVAVDLSQPSLEIAQKRLQQAGVSDQQVTWIQADLQTLEYPEHFDFIYCTGVLHHLSDPQAALISLRRHLKPHGLAAFMLYNPHARTEIRAIQTVLHQLWKDPKDLQEGLTLCRTFFRGLPSTHPFRQRFLRDQAIVRRELGEAFALSDAFLVDTYLQVCEQAYDLEQWWQMLNDTGWQLLRFLDEDSWQPARYLPGLPDYWQTLNFRERCRLLDPLRREHNYLFFAGASMTHWERPPIQFDLNTCAQRSPLVHSCILEDGSLSLDNRLGQILQLAPLARPLWEALDGNTPWRKICVSCITGQSMASKQLQQALLDTIQQMYAGYFVWT